MSTPQHSVSVAGIVVDEGNRVLLIQRRDIGRWEPPGGVLEQDETFEQGLRREVYEETGVEVRVGRLTGIYKNMSRGIVALVFRCQAESGRADATAEASRIEWMTVEHAAEVMAPAYYVRVADAFTPDVAMRAHDGVNLVDA